MLIVEPDAHRKSQMLIIESWSQMLKPVAEASSKLRFMRVLFVSNPAFRVIQSIKQSTFRSTNTINISTNILYSFSAAWFTMLLKIFMFSMINLSSGSKKSKSINISKRPSSILTCSKCNSASRAYLRVFSEQS
jgi:hypothetical protein